MLWSAEHIYKACHLAIMDCIPYAANTFNTCDLEILINVMDSVSSMVNIYLGNLTELNVLKSSQTTKMCQHRA
jgi:hypothetical protein